MGIRGFICAFFSQFIALNRTFALLIHQNYASMLLIESHRLEKCMCIKKPMTNRGDTRAIILVFLLKKLRIKNWQDSKELFFSYETALATLKMFVEYKNKIDGKSDSYLQLVKTIKESKLFNDGTSSTSSTIAGTQVVIPPHFDSSVDQLFISRHSCRNFSDVAIDSSKLNHAIELAITAPSACNRQPTRLYIFEDEDFCMRTGFSRNEYGAQKHIILTSDLTAYSYNEYNDWIVSTSIFAGYLSLALHSQGIGSCIMKKDLLDEADYNQTIKKIYNIPKSERIILELLIGNYPESFSAPISRRKSINDIVATNIDNVFSNYS